MITLLASPARSATPAGTAAVPFTAAADRDVLPALAEAYHASYVGADGPATVDAAAADLAATFDGEYGPFWPDASFTVGSGRVDGAVLLVRAAPWPDVGPIPFVVELFVRPERRRAGLGSALLGAAMDRLAEERVAIVGLRVAERNPAARALYERFGFRGAPAR